MDAAISQSMNYLLGKSQLFDGFILTLSSSHLAKGGMLVAIMLFAWLWVPADIEAEKKDRIIGNRTTILAALVASVFGEIFARFLSNYSSFRLRPFLEASLDMQVPDSLKALAPDMIANSSFPSDHAILFFAMATGIFMVSRRWGLFAFLYSSIFIAFPRIYLGLHYTSDIVIGAIIGIGFALAGIWLLRNSKVLKRIVGWSMSHPAFFYPVFFLFLFQVATMLQDVRDFAQLLKLL
ncbi:phosphatase PAP2 family protein [Parasphingorhabdus sp.]|uniref:phosphatase PAP2 family protein n=1 Tax=Parasphingorhabdus sp. TaxID=2709688 RepID=UPI003263287A